MRHSFEIRPLHRGTEDEVAWVAQRMRRTLVEVLGEARGGSMYTMDWLVQRVRWHLDPAREAEVLLALGAQGILGHTIVRVEPGDDGSSFGLFSTTWVEPAARRDGVASGLLRRGEAWMGERGLPRAATYTSRTNDPLITLYRAHGYEITERDDAAEMVVLSRPLP